MIRDALNACILAAAITEVIITCVQTLDWIFS